ncbi:MAG: hypothetical protein U1E65_31925 [Myxococcota bacterium]
MVSKISISNAASKMTEGFRTIVQDAAHNATLTPSERSHLSSTWAKNTIPNKSISVNAAVEDYLAPKIKKALFAVSSNKTSVTEADVQKLVVTDLRTAAAALFGPSGKMAKLQAALDDLDVQQLTDYGHSIGLDKQPVGTMTAAMTNIIGYDFDISYGWHQTKGAAAIKSFADSMRQVGKDLKQSTDEDPVTGGLTGQQIKDRYDAVADRVGAAFKPVTDFLSIRHLSHSIQEDGDTEYSILLAQKKDKSWVAVTYSDFPF